MKKGISLMAFGKARESKEFTPNLFVGVGAVNILAVNPDRKTFNELFKTDKSLEPINYVDKQKVTIDGREQEVRRIRISIVIKTDPKIACNNKIDTTQILTLWITESPWVGQKGKIQVIDNYGHNMWLDMDHYNNKTLPEGAGLAPEYHAAYRGEVDLISIIRAFLVLPRADRWDESSQTYVLLTDPQALSEAESVISDWDRIFKGDVTEIREALMGMPRNAFKLGFGVRTKQDGTQSQVFYTSYPMPLATRNYTQYAKKLAADAQAGIHMDTYYAATSLEKFEAKPTDYSEQAPTEEVPPPTVEDLPEDGFPFSGVDFQ